MRFALGYPDKDGDGYYSAQELASGDTVIGCVPMRGYAAEGGDCDADNANANPGAEEVCDLYTDENCNGKIDDRVHPLCGVGWCVRASFSCDEADCTPGQPSEEKCNFIDDDCDGLVDEGELCDEGTKETTFSFFSWGSLVFFSQDVLSRGDIM